MENQKGCSERRPRAPKRSRKARAWQLYYEQTAVWFADKAINLAEYPRAAEHAQSEAWRFLEGARELREGRHQNQIDGVWE